MRVTPRRIELLAPAIRFASLQVPEHRVFFERNRPAEVLDGGERVVPGERRVAPVYELAEVPLAAGRKIDGDRGGTGHHGKRQQQDPLHAAILRANPRTP